jgi:hypothetical protein
MATILHSQWWQNYTINEITALCQIYSESEMTIDFAKDTVKNNIPI